MRRKYGRLRKKENVIVFPGTFEKLVEKGHLAVDQEEYELAVEAFDQAIVYEPDHPEFLGPYAVALYETKDFLRAKEIAARLLHSGTADYVDAMELYLTISIQLQEYDEVEMTIDALIDEGIVPPEMLNKFNYLRELNGRLSERYAHEEPGIQMKTFTIDEFMKMDAMTQQYALASLEGSDLSAIAPLLVTIAERDDVAPLALTFALTLLHQTGYTGKLIVRKFGWEKPIVPAEMTLPGQDELTKKVREEIERLLFQDPSRLQMAQGLIEKFAITAFPFGWGDYQAVEVAAAYVNYIESLFSGERVPETALNLLIQQIDNDSDLS
ncbi:tetratricopeptide repeat protein [Sporosarcina sp. JAI121]|uniref:tetratricopeptide repeat protein n=1 Tax=Sporosarcina sp. JAI121 TaxID=2723064 RepID=UPI0015CA2F16|nr:tetratricopeptide repeat protein [Sporosarcina sp. JAI121]NYF25045.1 tetratricopeptide (TPR) repeat protein [Sporosarcina sp. JAI121]